MTATSADTARDATAPGAVAVSYTHLDVYKRQVLGIVEAMAVQYTQFLPFGLSIFGGSPWKDVWAFALLIICLLYTSRCV